MYTYSDKKRMPYTARQMFNLVGDIERYQDFLPWCLGSRIIKRQEGAEKDVLFADLLIGYKMFRETYTSRVELMKTEKGFEVIAQNVDGPFKEMKNHWAMVDRPEGGCLLSFDVRFEFKSFLLNQMMSGFFEEATQKMISSFEERAKALYCGR